MAGLTPSGLEIKTRPEIFASIQEKIKSRITPDWDDVSNNVINIVSNIFSEEMSEAWSGIASVYDGVNPLTAQAIALDNTAALNNIQRISSSKSIVGLEFTGAVGTVIPNTTVVENTQTKERFVTTSSLTLSNTQFSDITLSLNSVLDSTVYTLTINSEVVSINSGVGATTNSILQLLASEISTLVGLTVSLPTSSTLRINVTEVNSNLPISIGAYFDVDSVSDLVSAEAVSTGEVLALTGTLTNLLVPIGGITSVTNLEDAVVGRNREQDSELRVRRFTTVSNPAISTYSAIYSKLTNLSNVEYVNILANSGASTDSEGVPTKAFEVVVEGGDLDTIAQTIFENSPIAIENHGSISRVVYDENNNPITIKFSRPTKVYIHVLCEYKVYTEENQSSSLNSKIASLITDAGNSLTVGEDIIQERFFGTIYSNVSGVGKITISTAKSYDGITPITPFTVETLPVSKRELPTFRTDLVTVVQV